MKTKEMESKAEPKRSPAQCRVCNCDQMHACKNVCSWVEPDLCSTCHTAATAIAGVLAEWRKVAVDPDLQALNREITALKGRVGTQKAGRAG